MTVQATCLGHPRIGGARELKKALESYWASKTSAKDLLSVASALRQRHLTLMKDKGIDHVPSNDFSLYDNVLDMAVAVGAVPARYREIEDPLARYFAMARGHQDRETGIDVAALEMTKWFDTNYHYIVPELEAGQEFKLDAAKIVAEIGEARALGVKTRPVIPGPVTFLLLSKLAPWAPRAAATLDLLDRLLPVYEELLSRLSAEDVDWVQIDEPYLVLDLDERRRSACLRALDRLSTSPRRPRLLLATYFGALGDSLQIAAGSGFDALHVDLVRAPEQFDALLGAIPKDMLLSLGVVDGRNVWKTDLDAAHAMVRRAVERLGGGRVLVAPSCSLLHVPSDLSAERAIDHELKSWLAFAAQKLDEVRALADAAESAAPSGALFAEARTALASRRASPRTRNAGVRDRVRSIGEKMLRRTSSFAKRARIQRARFRLPAYPTTTIGSFPQSVDVRAARSA